MVKKRNIRSWRIIFVEIIDTDLIIRQTPDVNGAIIVLNPHSGDILVCQVVLVLI